MDRIEQRLPVALGFLSQRAGKEGNSRSGRHSPRDVFPPVVRPRRHAPRRRGSHLLNPANPGHPVLQLQFRSSCTGLLGSDLTKAASGAIALPEAVSVFCRSLVRCYLGPSASSMQSSQHDLHLWLFFAPSFSRCATVSRNGVIRCTGPFAMSAVVCPFRLTAITSAPLETR